MLIDEQSATSLPNLISFSEVSEREFRSWLPKGFDVKLMYYISIPTMVRYRFATSTFTSFFKKGN